MIAILLAAGLTTPFAPAQADKTFVVHTANGVFEGAVLELDDKWSIRLDAGTKVADLVSLKRKAATLPPTTPRNLLVLSNGDRIVLDPNTPPELRDDRLFFRPAGPLRLSKEPASISISLVSLLWFSGSDRDNEPLLTLRRLHLEPRSKDLILLKSGDQLEGTIASLDAKGLRASVNQRDTITPAAKLAAIAFNKELQARLRPSGPAAYLVLDNGTRLGLAKLQLKADSSAFHGKTLFGADCSIALHNVVSLQVRGGRAVYLSDLIARRYEHEPFLGLSWPLAKDANGVGGNLVLAGSAYDKGLGMHAGSRVTFDLKGEYRWFEALIGLDDMTGKRGRARYAVLVDGKVVTTNGSKELSANDPPRSIRVSVLKAKELTLVTDLSETFGDVQAHVNWADARLVR